MSIVLNYRFLIFKIKHGMTFEEVHNVKYYLSGNNYIVGNGTNINGNGITDPSYSGEITILEHIKGKPVTEVGQYAFRECHYITKIFIYAKITRINERSFSRCKNLEYINIPATVTHVDLYGLYFGDGIGVITKPIVVEFNKGRTKNIHFVGGSFTFRTNISIIYPYSRSPTFDQDDMFEGSTYISICAKSSFSFITKPTTTDFNMCPLPLFKEMIMYNTCRRFRRENNIKLLSLMIVLSVK